MAVRSVVALRHPSGDTCEVSSGFARALLRRGWVDANAVPDPPPRRTYTRRTPSPVVEPDPAPVAEQRPSLLVEPPVPEGDDPTPQQED